MVARQSLVMSTSKSPFGKIIGMLTPGSRVKLTLQEKMRKLYRIAYAWTHDPHLAGDLVQETMAKAIQNRHQLKNPEALDAWLYKILANCWRDHGRQSRAYVDINDIDLVWESDSEQESYRLELIQQVRQAVAKLNHDQRQIITLIDLEGLSYNEVADILSIPIGTVMSRLCRARRRLQELLQHANHPSFTHNVLPFK